MIGAGFIFFMDMLNKDWKDYANIKKIVAGVIRVWVFFFLSFLKAFYWYCFYNERVFFLKWERQEKIGLGTWVAYVLYLNYLMSLAINRSSFTCMSTSLGFYFFQVPLWLCLLIYLDKEVSMCTSDGEQMQDKCFNTESFAIQTGWFTEHRYHLGTS